MLSKEDNELLTRTNAGTPAGDLMRRYWIPALLSEEIPAPDCPPARVKLLGEELVAFRDTQGRIGLIGEHCAHRGTSLFFGRNEECGLRCIYHGWKYDVEGNVLDTPAEPGDSDFRKKMRHTAYPTQRCYLCLPRRARKDAALSQLRMDPGAAGIYLCDEMPAGVQLPSRARRRMRFVPSVFSPPRFHQRAQSSYV